jgi:hypothetical protein
VTCHEGPRSVSPGQLSPGVGNLSGKEEQWSDTLESLENEDQSLWKMTKRVVRVPTPSAPLQFPEGLSLSHSERDALADSVEAHFQPVNCQSEPEVIEMVNEVMRAYKYAPASEPKLTSPSKVQQAIRGPKVGKAPGPNGIPNKVLRHLSSAR